MYEGPVQNLIDELGKLPGVGPKSAQRIAFHLLQVEPEEIERLQGALEKIRDGVTYCDVCGTVAAQRRCRICSDPRRDLALVCVVEEPRDIEAIERTKEFHGVYHVLGGSLDPLNGIGPDQLRVTQLLRRVAGVPAVPAGAVASEQPGDAASAEPTETALRDSAPTDSARTDSVPSVPEDVREVIIATDPNTTGEATAAYLVRLLRDFPGLTISRLASGLPMGGDLEFADEVTLGHALSGRRILSQNPAAS